MKVISIIPARMASTRFPGKPLAEIHGVPMIGHIYFRNKLCEAIHEVYVATCDTEIRDYIQSIGGKAIMTHDRHERCTDRTLEALLEIERQTQQKADIVLMVQGDEPMVTPQMLNTAIQPLLRDPKIQVLNLMSELHDQEEHEDPNEVKVVVDLQGNALYFSREPIPSRKKGAKSIPMLKQVCIIPFRRDFLVTYAALAPTPLEIIESVDMMRVLEHGYQVRMEKISEESYSVDTPEDLEFVVLAMQNDPLRRQYTV